MSSTNIENSQKSVEKSASIVIFLSGFLNYFYSSFYAFSAPIIAPIFFPSQDYISSLILAYIFYATSILAKPIGVIGFNYFLSFIKPGRHINIFFRLNSATTILVGLIPTVEIAGFGTSIMLAILLFLREIFASGQKAINQFFLIDFNVENKENKLYSARRQSVFYHFTCLLAIILAQIIVYFISNSSLYMQQIYWRLIYIIVPTCCLLFPLSLENTDTKFRIKKFSLSYLTNFKGLLFKISFIQGASNILYSFSFVLFTVLMPIISEYDLNFMMQLNSILLIFDIILIPSIGLYVQKYNPRKILRAISALIFVSTPLLWSIGLTDIYLMILFRIWLITAGVCFSSCVNIWSWQEVDLSKFQQDKYNKYLPLTISYAIGSSLIGKTSPAIALIIYKYFANDFYIAIYLSLIFLICFIILTKIKID